MQSIVWGSSQTTSFTDRYSGTISRTGEWFSMSGMKSKLMNIHNELDNIFDELFRERKIKRQTNGATENDLLDVLFNIKERGGLQFPIEDNNIKAIFVVCL